MLFDLYIPQTANVFEETDTDFGIWLSGFHGSPSDIHETLRSIASTRGNTLGEDGPIDIVLRVYPHGGEYK